MKRKKRNAFTIIEVLITIFIIVSGFLVLYSVFTMAIRHATQTRNLVVGELMADSLIEEMKAHPYGTPLSNDWKEVQPATNPPTWEKKKTLFAIIQGRKIVTTYVQRISFKNGSLIGKSNADEDLVYIGIYWVEGTGLHGSGVKKKYRETVSVRRQF